MIVPQFRCSPVGVVGWHSAIRRAAVAGRSPIKRDFGRVPRRTCCYSDRCSREGSVIVTRQKQPERVKPERAAARRRNPEATRESIFEAAQALFVKRGYASVPLSEIAVRAGVTKSLIHHHFGSKEQLWQEVKRQRFKAHFDHQLSLLSSASPSMEMIRASITSYFEYLRDDPELVRLLTWSSAEGEDDEVLNQELIDLALQRARESQAAGVIRTDIEPIFFMVIFAAVINHWFQARDHYTAWVGFKRGEEPADFDDQFLESWLKMLTRGIEPAPADAAIEPKILPRAVTPALKRKN